MKRNRISKPWCNPKKRRHFYVIGSCVGCGIPQSGSPGYEVWNFWRMVDKNGPKGCWIWTRGVNNDGYGQAYGPWRTRLPHHISWFLKHGTWVMHPMEIDHLCNVRRCVNPKHLKESTHQENISRALSKRFCWRGHEQTPGNRYTVPSSGRTRCWPCIRVNHGKRTRFA